MSIPRMCDAPAGLPVASILAVLAAGCGDRAGLANALGLAARLATDEWLLACWANLYVEHGTGGKQVRFKPADASHRVFVVQGRPVAADQINPAEWWAADLLVAYAAADDAAWQAALQAVPPDERGEHLRAVVKLVAGTIAQHHRGWALDGTIDRVTSTMN